MYDTHSCVLQEYNGNEDLQIGDWLPTHTQGAEARKVKFVLPQRSSFLKAVCAPPASWIHFAICPICIISLLICPFWLMRATA